LDVHDSGWLGHTTHGEEKDYASPEAQCEQRYLLHLRGNGYSAGLKYKLACGSLVVLLRTPPYGEFYYPGLVEGVHYVAVDRPAGARAQERAVLVTALRDLLNELETAAGQQRAQAIAQAGQRFAMGQLSRRALSCYWLGVLVRYANLFFGTRGGGDKDGGGGNGGGDRGRAGGGHERDGGGREGCAVGPNGQPASTYAPWARACVKPSPNHPGSYDHRRWWRLAAYTRVRVAD
jgi:hypothetical protein